MATDKGSASKNSTALQSPPGYTRAEPKPTQTRALTTSIAPERTRTVMTHLTHGVVEVRIGLAEFPRRERSTSG
jgi:hypothetical protein